MPGAARLRHERRRTTFQGHQCARNEKSEKNRLLKKGLTTCLLAAVSR